TPLILRNIEAPSKTRGECETGVDGPDLETDDLEPFPRQRVCRSHAASASSAATVQSLGGFTRGCDGGDGSERFELRSSTRRLSQGRSTGRPPRLQGFGQSRPVRNREAWQPEDAGTARGELAAGRTRELEV